MKNIKFIIALLLLGVVGLGSAWADPHGGWHGGGHGGGNVRFGVMIGPYWGGPWYYPPYPYYYPPYYPPVVAERSTPQVYIEQQPAPAAVPAAPVAAAPANYWYYCAPAKAYYPYVRECPSGWQKVVPQPPAQP